MSVSSPPAMTSPHPPAPGPSGSPTIRAWLMVDVEIW
uniref:Uncharacterized protein n=1 Tax=Paracalanus parvus TaxID=187406 RepID=A0A0U2LGN4_9MAXI|nr:hypothetical protein [Paracalanus parvus]